MALWEPVTTAKCLLTRFLTYALIGVGLVLFITKPKWFRRFRKVGFVSKIVIYPVSSCVGVPLTEAFCGKSGIEKSLMRDREFLVVLAEEDGYQEQAQSTKLSQISLSYDGNNLIMSAPAMKDITCAMHPIVVQSVVRFKNLVKGKRKRGKDQYHNQQAFVNGCGQVEEGLDCGHKLSTWFNKLLNAESARLLRRIDVIKWRPPSHTIFADKPIESDDSDESLMRDKKSKEQRDKEEEEAGKYAPGWFRTLSDRARNRPKLFTLLKNKMKHRTRHKDLKIPRKESENEAVVERLAKEEDVPDSSSDEDVKSAEEELIGNFLENGKQPRLGMITVHTTGSMEKISQMFKTNYPMSDSHVRANVVISGCDEFEELTWDMLCIGDEARLIVQGPDTRFLEPENDGSGGTYRGETEPLECPFNKWLIPASSMSPLAGVKTTVSKEGTICIGDPVYALTSDYVFE